MHEELCRYFQRGMANFKIRNRTIKIECQVRYVIGTKKISPLNEYMLKNNISPPLKNNLAIIAHGEKYDMLPLKE